MVYSQLRDYKGLTIIDVLDETSKPWAPGVWGVCLGTPILRHECLRIRQGVFGREAAICGLRMATVTVR
jgi:hypothetical protein